MQGTALIELRRQLDKRMSALRVDRMSYWHHWRELSKYILPRRGRYLETPNKGNKGSPVNQAIIDPTATKAAAVCASGMMAGITSPARPWFNFKLSNDKLSDDWQVKEWLGECKKRLMAVLAKSNFYNAFATLYEEIAVFGTAVVLILEDDQSVIRCYPITAGQYYLGLDHRNDTNSVYREFAMTVGQVVDDFGLDSCSQSVQSLHKTGAIDKEIIVCHAIEPNDKRIVGAPGVGGSAFRSVYWEKGQATELVLKIEPFYEKPFVAPRWDVVAGDAYGRGPGMDVLPLVKQLQHEQLRKGQGIDKMVNPPMVADATLKNEPATLIPGGITYVQSNANSIGFKPIYEVDPQLAELKQDIQDIRDRIGEMFFRDVFMMISQLETVRTATEIDARKEEKLLMLGPMLERFHNEGLDPALHRVWSIMWRNGMFPLPPPQAQGQGFEIEYISTLAQAQKAVATTGIERLAGFAGNLAGAKPEVLDKINFDEAIDEYADALGVDPKVIVATDKANALRDARAKQMQQQQAMQNNLAMVQGAKTLSETETGAGQNALQRMLGA